MKKIIVLLGIGVLVLGFLSTSYAGPPFNTVEGVGGITFNPLAYTAGTSFDKDATDKGFTYKDVFSKPQIGGWYVSLSQPGADLTTMGFAETFFKRLEVSYGYESFALDRAQTVHKNNIGAKGLLLEENFQGLNFLPAVSAGAIWKQTSHTLSNASDSWDYYLVATKTIPQLPVPVILSAGVLATKGWATGLLGYDKDYKGTFFANIDVIPIKQLAVGFEYKQGANFSNFNNADIWSVHAVWFATKNLSLIAAYVNTGPTKSSARIGLGDGPAVSAQYAF